MYRAVVDTNLIVSGTASLHTPPYHLLEAWRQGKYILVTSPILIEEVSEVLRRPKLQRELHLTEQDRQDVLATLSTQAFITAGTVSVDVVANDPDDNQLIACALEGSATHIVTGDKKHLLQLKQYQGIQIVTARTFLEDALEIHH